MTPRQNTSEPRVIGVDIDGVLVDHIPSRCELMRELYDIDITPDDFETPHPPIPVEGVTREDFNRDLHENHPELFERMDPVEGAIEAVRDLRSDSRDVWLVTHRLELIRAQSDRWLTSHDVPYDNIIYEAPANKADVSEIDLLIDDTPDVVRTGSQSGLPSILFGRHYNSHVEVTHPNAYQISDAETVRDQWERIVRLIDDAPFLR